MECKVEGRAPAIGPKPDLEPLSYGLEHLTPGQRKFALIKAAEFLQRVMMDPKAPTIVKDVLRSQNALGMLALEQVLAAHVENELKSMYD